MQASASRRLENLRSAFDTIRTYPFSEACGHPRGPVGYFLDFLGIENVGAFEFVTENESLSNNAIRLLRYVEDFEPLILDGKRNPNRHECDLKDLWAIPGSKFRLTWEEYETVREQIEFENAWLESNLGREYCDEEIELRWSDVHWDEGSLRAVRNALPEVPDVLVSHVYRYFEEVQGIILTGDIIVPELPDEVIRSVDGQLRSGQLDDDSAVELLRSAIGDDKGDRRLYDRACELLLQMGKIKEAVCLAEEGLARFGRDLALMSRLAYAYAAGGETDRALVQWARVRQAHPSAEEGWIEAAMCSATLSFGNEACELLGAYLAQLEGRLSRRWWDRVLQVTDAILLEYSEDRPIRGLLESLFFQPVAPDLANHFELFSLLRSLTARRWQIKNSLGDYRKSEKILDLLKEIHQHFSIRSNEEQAIALELALGIDVNRESPDRIREFLIDLSFQDFCKIFSLRCRPEVQFNFLFERGDIQEMIAELPVTDRDNAKKCLAMRYALGMDYSAAYEALTGLPLPTADNYYSNFAYAAYTGNGRPKVAFCVSGQLRGYKEAFASWKKSRLFADCDVSVFVHTWPEVSTIRFDPHFADRMFSGNFLQAFVKECSESKGDINRFKKMYANLVRMLSESRTVCATELSDFYETPHVVVESEEPYRTYGRQKKMCYKVQACWELACANDGDFHFMFRIRPDLTLRDDSKVDWHEIIMRSQNEKIIYIEYLIFYDVGLAVEDYLAFGNPAAMAVYSNAWSRMKDPSSLICAYSRRAPGHVSFALSLAEQKVKVVPFPDGFVTGKLLGIRRPSLEFLREALDKDLTLNIRHQNPMWQALKEDISLETEQK